MFYDNHRYHLTIFSNTAIKIILMAVLATLGSFPSFAESVSMTPAMKSLPFKLIGSYTSRENEKTLNVFLLRIAPNIEIIYPSYRLGSMWFNCKQ